MPWSDLTKEQQKFLKTYLKSSTWDFIGGKGKAKVNKTTVAEFEKFEKLDQAYLALVVQIPQDYDERTSIEAEALAAYDHRTDGDFDDAATVMTGVLSRTRKTVTDLTDAAGVLRASAKPVIVGLNKVDSDEIDRLHAKMMQRLVPAIPTRAEFLAAQSDEVALGVAADRIRLATIARRKKSRLDFEGVFATVKPALETASKFDGGPFRRAPQGKELTSAIAAASKLLNDAELAAKSDDEAAHLDLATKLTDWNKTATQIETLATKAKAAFRGALSKGYDAIKKSIAADIATKVDMYAADDQLALKQVTDVLTISKNAVESALSGTDPVEQLRMYDELGKIKEKMAEFDRLQDAARDNRVKATLKADGVVGAQAEGIVKLRKAAPKVLQAVGNTINKTNKVLGKVEVTTQLIADRTKLRDDELKKYQDLGQEIKGLETQVKAISDKIKQDTDSHFAVQIKEVEAIAARVQELKGDTTTAAVKEVEKLMAQAQDVDKEMSAWALKEKEKQKTVLDTLAKSTAEAKKKRAKAGDDYNAQGKFIAAAETKKRLLDAVAFGPLAPDRAKPLDEASLLKLTELYDKNWELADHTASVVGTAKNPASVIEAAETVNARVGNSFGNKKWSAERAKSYGNNLVTMSGGLPPELVQGLGTYLDGGNHTKDAPEVNRGATFAELAKNRTASVGKAMVKSDGSLDLDGALQGVMDVAFHPRSIINQQPALVTHMFETVEYFKKSTTAQDKIKAVTLPTDKGALALLAKGSGLDETAITQDTARQEVVNAMLTPVYQGDIGSCFATVGVVKLRKTDPDRALDLYSEIATKGTFTPKNPDPSKKMDPIPAVQNLPKDDNPLIRSLEFSIATAAALDADSGQKTDNTQRTAAAVQKLEAKIKPKKWKTVSAKLKAAVPDGFTLLYNSEFEIKDSGDGSSTKGGYELISKASGKGVNTEADYVKEVTKIVLAQISADDMASKVTVATITDFVKSREFLDSMKVDGKMPWELGSGGRSTEATKVLNGTKVKNDDFLPKSTAAEDVSTRTRNIMQNMLGAFDGSTEEMAGLEAGGKHGFNALPQDPSLAPLKQGGKAKFAENLDRELVKKGADLKNTDIPAERAAYMVEKQLRSLSANAKGAEKKALDDAILAHRPTTALKPAALKAFIETATADYVKEVAKAQADTWKAEEKVKNSGTDPTDEEYTKKVDAVKKATKEELDVVAMNLLMADLEVPQFMVADTNWGSGQDHVFFVIAPDPATGDAQMFRRNDPGGKLTPVTEDWVKTNWLQVH